MATFPLESHTFQEWFLHDFWIAPEHTHQHSLRDTASWCCEHCVSVTRSSIRKYYVVQHSAILRDIISGSYVSESIERD